MRYLNVASLVSYAFDGGQHSGPNTQEKRFFESQPLLLHTNGPGMYPEQHDFEVSVTSQWQHGLEAIRDGDNLSGEEKSREEFKSRDSLPQEGSFRSNKSNSGPHICL